MGTFSILLILAYLISFFCLFYSFRKQEYKADMFAAEKYNSESVINTLSKLSEMNKENIKPNPIRQFLSTHPH